jgi:hypothetical protein
MNIMWVEIAGITECLEGSACNVCGCEISECECEETIGWMDNYEKDYMKMNTETKQKYLEAIMWERALTQREIKDWIKNKIIDLTV